MSQDWEYITKLIFPGEGAVGKTSLIRRFDGKSFSNDYKQTIGVNFYSKILTINIKNEETSEIEEKKVYTQIWDLAGQKRFEAVRNYSSGAIGGLLTFDITDKVSFDSLPTWMNEIDKARKEEKIGDVFYLGLIGNKIDLEEVGTVFVYDEEGKKVKDENGNLIKKEVKREVKLKDAYEFAEKLGIPYYETSALENKYYKIINKQGDKEEVTLKDIIKESIIEKYLKN